MEVRERVHPRDTRLVVSRLRTRGPCEHLTLPFIRLQNNSLARFDLNLVEIVVAEFRHFAQSLVGMLHLLKDETSRNNALGTSVYPSHREI